jgi:hypothetical protein
MDTEMQAVIADVDQVVCYQIDRHDHSPFPTNRKSTVCPQLDGIRIPTIPGLT